MVEFLRKITSDMMSNNLSLKRYEQRARDTSSVIDTLFTFIPNCFVVLLSPVLNLWVSPNSS